MAIRTEKNQSLSGRNECNNSSLPEMKTWAPAEGANEGSAPPSGILEYIKIKYTNINNNNWKYLKIIRPSVKIILNSLIVGL
jgi:hypothetical protein